MESISYTLQQIDGKHDVKELKRELDSFPGVRCVAVNAAKNKLTVDYDPTGVSAKELQNRLDALGYAVKSCS